MFVWTLFVFGSCFRMLTVILFQIIFKFFTISTKRSPHMDRWSLLAWFGTLYESSPESSSVQPPQQSFRWGYHPPVCVSLAGAATSIIFVMTKHVFCRDKSRLETKIFCCDNFFVATSVLLLWQKTCFVVTKVCLLLQISVATSFVTTDMRLSWQT